MKRTFLTFACLSALALAACGDDDNTKQDAAVEDDAAVTCNILGCENNTGHTCESDPFTVDCTEFGATCGDFTDTESDDAFSFCTCGDLAEGEGKCFDGTPHGILCHQGLAGLTTCDPGMVCAVRENGPVAVGCDCDNADDGICPAATCTDDPDCADDCTPDCAGKVCGSDGCTGNCGECAEGTQCSADQSACEAM